MNCQCAYRRSWMVLGLGACLFINPTRSIWFQDFYYTSNGLRSRSLSTLLISAIFDIRRAHEVHHNYITNESSFR
ncbi:uncharacterized protein LAJ45_01560 [Morchella importuna]|uniref:uncharacterized protein n=1 Tax=Morchella importuna TaxID=1174673 RepID=UPI001E8E471A|nr:uncharacterized protein LAJ45_01560 [Morchella importuna]KAH8153793.1 hypothetical protein LAJ45_01560 [Morchella importuna]